jgi:antitoxin (DNA-binding transcriptional repressor) of toxin-antitoxin stability system
MNCRSISASKKNEPHGADYIIGMTATLRETQADLQRWVELASRGEDVVITVDGRPKAKLTRAGPVLSSERRRATPAGLANWPKELKEIRRQLSTGKAGPTAAQILAEDRADRI